MLTKQSFRYCEEEIAKRRARERGREARATQIEWNATAAVTVVGSGGGDGGDGGNKESNSERAMF
jgi:hypothetical protein